MSETESRERAEFEKWAKDAHLPTFGATVIEDGDEVYRTVVKLSDVEDLLRRVGPQWDAPRPIPVGHPKTCQCKGDGIITVLRRCPALPSAPKEEQ